MKNWNRILSLALILAMLAPLSACGEDTGNPKDTDSSDTTDTSAPETTEPQNPSGLPYGIHFDGEEITFLTREDDEIGVDTTTGETLNDAIWTRNEAVQSTLGVKLNIVKRAGAWNDRDAFMEAVRQDHTSDSGEFDIVIGYQYYIPSLIPEGIFANLAEVPHINLEQPWWNESLRNDLMINGKIYSAASDMTLSVLQNMYVTYFNKTLIEDIEGLENPYDLVAQNKWTLDTFKQMSSLGYHDVNGNGKMDNADRYGTVQTGGGNFDALLAGFDQPHIEAQEDGTLKITIYSEKTLEIAEALQDLFYNTEGCLGSVNNVFPDFNNQILAWTTDRMIFFVHNLSMADRFREMESDFGVVPLPKWNEEQENYHSVSGDISSLICVKANGKANREAVGATLEQMSYESYVNVKPAYYEGSLQYGMLRDRESFEMIDLSRKGLVYDIGRVYSILLGDINHWFRYLVQDNNRAYASSWQGNAQLYEAKLKELQEFYQSTPEA